MSYDELEALIDDKNQELEEVWNLLRAVHQLINAGEDDVREENRDLLESIEECAAEYDRDL